MVGTHGFSFSRKMEFGLAIVEGKKRKLDILLTVWVSTETKYFDYLLDNKKNLDWWQFGF